MKIFDKEFAFSSLNANDIERLEQARAKLEKRPRRPSVSVHSGALA